MELSGTPSAYHLKHIQLWLHVFVKVVVRWIRLVEKGSVLATYACYSWEIVLNVGLDVSVDNM
jgi:hypothetical protein